MVASGELWAEIQKLLMVDGTRSRVNNELTFDQLEVLTWVHLQSLKQNAVCRTVSISQCSEIPTYSITADDPWRATLF
jgi:hypothetical protein